MRDHKGHDLGACSVFFQASPRKRRGLCRTSCCFTCLGSDDKCCPGQCARIADVPLELLCTECTNQPLRAGPPPTILFCGLRDHNKPDEQNYLRMLRQFVPGFQNLRLTAPLGIWLARRSTPRRPRPPQACFAPPGGQGCTGFNTQTGLAEQLSPSSTVVRPSTEEPFYIMQTLCIAGERALTFFDSGANTHLVEGSLAEHAGFTVLSDRSVSIGVVGGGTIRSGYGQYSCILGPDVLGRHHEIECQGLERISEEFPQFDLRPIHLDFRTSAPEARGQLLPSHIGGDRVRLLSLIHI